MKKIISTSNVKHIEYNNFLHRILMRKIVLHYVYHLQKIRISSDYSTFCKSFVTYFNENNAFFLFLFRISKILHKIWERRVRKFVSQRHLWPTLKMKIAYQNTKQVHILIDYLCTFCLFTNFVYFFFR